MRTSIKFLNATLLIGAVITVPLTQADDGEINRIIVFGDSLADGGYYSDLNPMLPPGQSFTTNPDPVAPEVFGAQLGIEVDPVYGENGTNHAVGGARVTQANGLSIPVATQIDNFLNAGGSFREDDVVYIQGGGNDFFAYQTGGSTDPSILTTAATELADQVARIQAAGAPDIVTMAVQSGGAPGLQLFNQTYEEALVANNVNALYFDADALFNELVINASEFGFVNISDPACGAVDSLECGPADYVTPDANETYILADSVHPAGKTQRIQGQAIASLVVAPEQIGQLAYAGQSLLRSHRQLSIFAADGQAESGDTGVFVKVGSHRFDNDDSLQFTAVEETSTLVSLGMEHQLAKQTRVGVALGLSDGDGEFANNRGDYNVDALSALFYVQGRADNLEISADLMLGRTNYDDLTRNVQLGPVLRRHSGDTEADFFGLSAQAAYYFALGGGWELAPRLGVDYQTYEIDGYSEENTLSTNARFGDQELDSLNGVVGVKLAYVSGAVNLYLDTQFNREFKDDERSLTITPAGAPISYTSDLYLAEDQYLSAALGGVFSIAEGFTVDAGINTTTGRDETSSTGLFVGLKVDF